MNRIEAQIHRTKKAIDKTQRILDKDDLSDSLRNRYICSIRKAKESNQRLTIHNEKFQLAGYTEQEINDIIETVW